LNLNRFAFLLFALFVFGRTAAQTVWVDAKKDDASMTYRLTHPLHEIEATSKEVEYRAQLDPAKHEFVSVTGQVDVMTFSSGNSNRDSHAMEVIDAITYPYASFESTGITRSGDSLRVTGKVTFHGVTRDVVIPAKSLWSADRVEVSGAFDLSLKAHSIDRPSLLMIPVDDELRFTFDAVFRFK
jgi:polyisoprenoid-binding protein YceI